MQQRQDNDGESVALDCGERCNHSARCFEGGWQLGYVPSGDGVACGCAMPVTIGGDADCVDGESSRVHGGDNMSRRYARDIMLGRLAAEEHHQSILLRHVAESSWRGSLHLHIHRGFLSWALLPRAAAKMVRNFWHADDGQ